MSSNSSIIGIYQNIDSNLYCGQYQDAGREIKSLKKVKASSSVWLNSLAVTHPHVLMGKKERARKCLLHTLGLEQELGASGLNDKNFFKVLKKYGKSAVLTLRQTNQDQSWSLSEEKIERVKKKLPFLQGVSIDYNEALDPDHFEQLLQSFPERLSMVEVFDASKLGEGDLEKLVQYDCSVRQIRLHKLSSSISGEILATVLRSLPLVVDLSIFSEQVVCDSNFLDEITSMGNDFKTLCLGKCGEISDEQVLQLLESKTNLNYLQLVGLSEDRQDQLLSALRHYKGSCQVTLLP